MIFQLLPSIAPTVGQICTENLDECCHSTTNTTLRPLSYEHSTQRQRKSVSSGVTGWFWVCVAKHRHWPKTSTSCQCKDNVADTQTHLGDFDVIVGCWLTQTSEVRIVTAAIWEQIAGKEDKQKSKIKPSISNASFQWREAKPKLSQCRMEEWCVPRLTGRHAGPPHAPWEHVVHSTHIANAHSINERWGCVSNKHLSDWWPSTKYSW